VRTQRCLLAILRRQRAVALQAVAQAFERFDSLQTKKRHNHNARRTLLLAVARRHPRIRTGSAPAAPTSDSQVLWLQPNPRGRAYVVYVACGHAVARCSFGGKTLAFCCRGDSAEAISSARPLDVAWDSSARHGIGRAVLWVSAMAGCARPDYRATLAVGVALRRNGICCYPLCARWCRRVRYAIPFRVLSDSRCVRVRVCA
jgi:hypothetical protein